MILTLRKLVLILVVALQSLVCGCTKNDVGEDTEPEMEQPPVIAETIEHPRLMHNPAQLDIIKTKIAAGAQPWTSAYQQLLNRANATAARNHVAVASFSVPPFYTDPTASGAAKDGYLADSHAAYANALAYKLQGNAAYAHKAIYFLNAWASTNQTIGTSGDTPLVSAYGGVGFILAADLLLGANVWPVAKQVAFKTWVRSKYLPVVNAIRGNSNNWGDWATFAVICAHGLLDDEAKVKEETARVKVRIDQHIAVDGHLPQEVRRGENGVWYTYFALSAMTASARVVQNATGENLFTYVSPSGKTYKKALDYLYHHMYHQQSWPWHPMGARNLNNLIWPVDLFEGVNQFYDDAYLQLVEPFRPVLGGYKNDFVKPTHVSWNYPTLMRTK